MTWFIYAIVASLGLSIVTLLQKRVLKGEHAMEFVTTLSLLNLVISFPLFLTIDYQSLKIVPLLIIAATSIFSSISITLNARSLRHMEVSASSPLYVLTPAVSALLGLIFLGEYLSFYQSLGIGILIIGTFLLEIDSYTKLKSFRVFIASKYVYYILLSILLFGVSP
jgi:drug/metabolite transporter (DMT)-like permease